MRPAALAWLLGAWLSSSLGCSADIPQGRFACDEDDDCPGGWHCVDGLCYDRAAQDAGGALDGSSDADTADGGGLSDGSPPEDGSLDAAIDGSALDGGLADAGACPADPDDPGSCGAPHELGELTLTATLQEETITGFGLHDHGDEDVFELWLRRSTVGVGANIRVRLDGIPAGSNYDVGVGAICEGSGDAGRMCSGSNFSENLVCGASGCTGTASGTTSEDVTINKSCAMGRLQVFVRVTSSTWAGMCADYRLRVAFQGA